jgi:predicted CoA-binding protein
MLNQDMNVDESQIKLLLDGHRKITVIGLSPKVEKPSHQIPLFMASNGCEVVGVYPGEDKIGPFTIYPSLSEVPAPFRKFVNVFRRSEDIPDLVDQTNLEDL